MLLKIYIILIVTKLARKLYVRIIAVTQHDPVAIVSSLPSEPDKLRGTPPFTAPGASPTPGAF